MPLSDKVKEFIKINNLISDGETIIAAFSGGADSVCMLHILNRLSSVLNFQLAAAHLNHSIRGAEALRDADFAKEFCLKLNIPFYIKTIDVPMLAKKLSVSLEDAGRRARYEFFDELLQSLNADKIATAHNKNDNAETVLHRILRGSGIDGLQGILCRRDNIIRPVLSLTRDEIENYCKENSLSFVTDSTNLDHEYTRNKIRLDLIPFLQKDFNPNIINNLCNLSEIAACDKNYLNSSAKDAAARLVLFDKNYSCGISVSELIKQHLSIKRRLLLLMAKYSGCDIEFKHISPILDMINKGITGKTINIPGGKAEISYDRLIFTRKSDKSPFSYDITPESDIFISEAGLRVKAYKFGETKGILLPCDRKIEIRSRKNGDKIKINNMTKKISDLFIDLKIPRSIRDKSPILTVDDVPVNIIGIKQGDISFDKNNNLFVLNITQEEHNNEK